MRDAEHARIRRADRTDRLLGIVGAAVVDEDDLVVDVEVREGALEPLGHDGNGLGVLVAGDDRRHAVDAVERALLGGALVEFHILKTRVPARGARQSLAERDLGAPPEQARGARRIGVPIRDVPVARRHRGELRLLLDAKLPLREIRQFANGRLAPAADIEGLPVVIAAQFDRRAQERAGDVIHIDEIARGLGVDERREASLGRFRHERGDEPRAILERSVDRIEPKVRAAQTSMAAGEVHQPRGGILGHRIMAVRRRRHRLIRTRRARAVFR